jgi:hypothetical protein
VTTPRKARVKRVSTDKFRLIEVGAFVEARNHLAEAINDPRCPRRGQKVARALVDDMSQKRNRVQHFSCVTMVELIEATGLAQGTVTAGWRDLVRLGYLYVNAADRLNKKANEYHPRRRPKDDRPARQVAAPASSPAPPYGLTDESDLDAYAKVLATMTPERRLEIAGAFSEQIAYDGLDDIGNLAGELAFAGQPELLDLPPRQLEAFREAVRAQTSAQSEAQDENDDTPITLDHAEALELAKLA